MESSEGHAKSRNDIIISSENKRPESWVNAARIMSKSLLTFVVAILCHSVISAQMTPNNFLGFGALSEHYNGNGCSFVDFNQDGWDDVTFGTPNGIVFLQNNQNGDFNPVDLGISNSGDARHPMWIDIDNDGDLDFFTTNCLSPSRLWLNQGESGFLDISSSCGIEQTVLWESHGASWGDLNGDGFLDLYINNYNKEGIFTNYLYLNNGDATFTDITNTCNCDNGSQESFQSVWFDFNQDGLQDLAVINDRLQFANALYINQGDGTFIDIASEVNFDLLIYAMTISITDYGHDDDDDFYITNSIVSNVFLENNDSIFTDVAPQLGVEINEVCWGAQWFDYDNDADEDLFVGTFNSFNEVPNYFFLNNNGTFESHPENIGYNSSDVHASAAGDFNNDGFTDIVLHTFQEHFRILNNTPNENNWLKINLQGTVSNGFGVGSELRLYSGGQFQKRTVFCGEDYMGQDSYTELFGLATSNLVDSLEVTWPSGWTDMFYDLDVNQTVLLTEGSTFQPELVFTGDACSNQTNLLSVTGVESGSYVWNNQTNEPDLVIESSGEYSVVVENSFGLSAELSMNVVLNEAPNPQVNSTNVTCAGGADGMIELFNVSGIIVETVDWNNGVYAGEAIFGLIAGDYEFVMTDANGCAHQDTVTITEPLPVQANLTYESPLCSDEFGMAEVNPSGGTGNFDIIWSAEDPSTLPEGDFQVEVIDDSGCSILTPFSIFIPSEISAELTVEDANDGDNGSASISVEGGTPPYTVQWSNSDIGEQTDQLGQGAYVVIVTDNNGCTWSESFSIIDTNVDELYSDAIIRSLGNGLFTVQCSSIVNEMILLDAQGRIIETSSPFQSTFQVDLSSENAGMYFILIRLENNAQLKFEVVKY